MNDYVIRNVEKRSVDFQKFKLTHISVHCDN